MLKHPRRYFALVKETLKATSSLNMRNVVLIIGFALLGLQALQLNSYIARNADSRPVIAGLDNDASNAIDVAGRSRWYMDNGFAGYGPLYFRLAHTLDIFLTPMTEPGNLPPAEAETKSTHYSLMLISLLALVGLSIFLSFQLLGKTPLWPLASVFLTWALMHSTTWQWSLLVAHPDLLLGLIASVAAWLTFRVWQEPSHKYSFRLAAWVWGLAFCTKMSMVLFYPFALFGLTLVTKTNRLQTLLSFIGHSLATYFLFGFPQNFNLPRTFRFLFYQKQYSRPPNIDSVIEWLQIYGQQVWLPFAVAIILLIVSLSRVRGPKPVSTRLAALALLMAFGPLLLMLAQRILMAHDHYIIPVIAVQLALVIGFATSLLKARALKDQFVALIAAVSVLLLLFINLTPLSLNSALAKQLSCRPEARAVYTELQKHQASGLKIYIDPYVPSMNKTPNVHSSWRVSKGYVVENGFDVLILNRTRFKGLFSQDIKAYLETYNKTLNDTQDFYVPFLPFDSSEGKIADPTIGHWQKVYKNQCGWEIWTRGEK